MPSEKQIDELRHLEAEATPGPWLPEWKLSKDSFCQVSAFSEDGNRILQNAIKSFKPAEDAALIVAMRNALPELLKALEWQPIETIPTESIVLLGNRNDVEFGYRDRGGRFFICNNGDYTDGGYGNDYQTMDKPTEYMPYGHPTHWMPLPLPPHGGRDDD